MAFKTLDSANLSGKRVLVRVDLNVPMENGKVADATRIERVVPTIMEIGDKGGKVILLAHFGRPKGRDPKESLKPVVAELHHILKRHVGFADDCVGEAAEKAVAAMKNGDVLLLENTRFHKEEEKNDPAFADQLAKLGDIYVNDAFGTAHRQHGSTYGVAEKIGAGKRAIGFLIEKEIKYLGEALDKPQRPFIAILGGAKVTDKIAVIENLLAKADSILIGGAMAYTFFL